MHISVKECFYPYCQVKDEVLHQEPLLISSGNLLRDHAIRLPQSVCHDILGINTA